MLILKIVRIRGFDLGFFFLFCDDCKVCFFVVVCVCVMGFILLVMFLCYCFFMVIFRGVL